MFFDLDPFSKYILIIILSLAPTWFIYVLIGKGIKDNLAHIEGTWSGFAIKLGGPAAFYFLMLFLGREYISNFEITFRGIVSLEGQGFGDKAKVEIIRLSDGKKFEETTDSQGSFSITIPNVSPGINYKITWNKEGYQEQKRSFELKNIPLLVTLTKGVSN